MRFFEFVSCCGLPTRRPEEERSLVPAPAQAPITRGSRALRRMRRGRKVRKDWRPSLGSIAEHNTVSPTIVKGGRPNSTRTMSGRDVKRRTSGGAVVAGVAKVPHRRYSDGYHRSPTIRTITPTLCETPFMFGFF